MPRPGRHLRLVVGLIASFGLLALGIVGLQPAGAKGGAGAAGGAGELAALSTLPVPTPPNIQQFVKDSTAAKKLGKALFWDMQAGADGRQACASCHYNAGADNRSRNQINPRGGGFTLKGPNAQLTTADFPLHKLSDPNNSASAVLSDTTNVVGSQGVIPAHFKDVTEGDPFDGQSLDGLDADFHVGSVNVRRSTGRNTPSAINAVFNFRNFWDGRAQNDFNGVDPFGNRDGGARVGKVGSDGNVEQVQVSIANSSLASQATGPPGNEVEMSTFGRSLSDIGKKLLSVRPLASQEISKNDSLLGNLADSSGRGLDKSYEDMIKDAFGSDWWDSNKTVQGPGGRTYSLMQYNFALFWGLAIQEYESSLVSDQSPVDRFLSGDTSALSADAQAGMSIFTGKGQCSSCHEGAAFTDATVDRVAQKGLTNGLQDTGFHNIGVRPSTVDAGQDGSDPFGNPLSVTMLNGGSNAGVAATFKTPDLRNVALTAPYFHNGGQMTLRQVVDFYSRGGDFPGELGILNLTDQEKDQLVAFLEALTDPRVKDQSAPFDHPELFVPIGEQTRADGSVITDGNGRAVDCFKRVAATGAGGGAALAAFPDFTGPSCDSAPPLELHLRNQPVSSVNAGPSVSKPAAPAGGSKRAAPSVLNLLMRTRLSLHEVHRRGLRLGVTVPKNARRLRIRVYRLRGSHKVKVGEYVVRIKKGGRVKITFRTSLTRHIKAGSYLLQVDAGPRHGAYLPGGAQTRLRLR
jgi:cytochrome c peroxidase